MNELQGTGGSRLEKVLLGLLFTTSSSQACQVTHTERVTPTFNHFTPRAYPGDKIGDMSESLGTEVPQVGSRQGIWGTESPGS